MARLVDRSIARGVFVLALSVAAGWARAVTARSPGPPWSASRETLSAPASSAQATSRASTVSPVEPEATVTFDPYECEARLHLAYGLGNVGVEVGGNQGESCVFYLAFVAAPSGDDRRVTATLAECTAPRGGPMVTIPWGIEEPEVAGTRCSATTGLTEEAMRQLQEQYRARWSIPWGPGDFVRYYELPGGDGLVEPGRVKAMRLAVSVWPASLHRPDLAALDPRQLVVRDRGVAFDMHDPQLPAPLRSVLYGRPSLPRRFRFSVPLSLAGALAADVGDRPGGRYVAAEVEIIETTAAPPPKPTTGPIVIDAANCSPGDSDQRSLGLGSQSVAVVGKQGADCIFEVTSEVEGGYITSECRVPARDVVTIENDGLVPGRIPETCVTKKTGNSLLELPAQKVVVQVSIRGTGFVAYHYTEDEGSGAPVKRGASVQARVSIWGPGEQRLDLTGALDAAAARVRDREVTLTLGEATYGKALDAVLLEPPLRLGGTRRYEIRTEVTGAFAKLLDGVTLVPEQYLTVEVTLLGAAPEPPKHPTP